MKILLTALLSITLASKVFSFTVYTSYDAASDYLLGDIVPSSDANVLFYQANVNLTGGTHSLSNSDQWVPQTQANIPNEGAVPTEEVPSSAPTESAPNYLPPDSNSTTDSGNGTIDSGGPVFYGISSRAYVDDAPMVGSIIINGTEPKKVMVRAKGPSMASALPNKKLLANPKITILQKGTDGWSTIETTYDYGDHSSASAYADLATDNNLEPMIVVTLDPGTYSMRVQDESGGTGNANLEIYEIENDTSSSVFYGISSRAYVDDAPMVGSIIINGTEPKKVMVRAKGPSMASALPNKKLLANPKITILQKGTDGWSTIETTYDYGDHSSASAHADLATDNNLEPMIVVTLDPGTYSMRVQDESGGTGNANLEIYEVE